MQCDFETIIEEESPQAVHLAHVVKELFTPSTAIDIGCGPGIYVQSLREVGINAIGIDNDNRATGEGVRVCDILSDEFERIVSTRFDLAICLEVLEHIDASLAEAVIERICTSSDIILFSAAVPGQGGIGHINCQPKPYWVDLFEKCGFSVDYPKTLDIVTRMSSGAHMGWFVNNAMILRRKSIMEQKPLYRFHIPGLPHTKTNVDYTACAYTMKVRKLCRMLTEAGHTVFHYGVEGSDPVCTENVTVVSAEMYKKHYDYDWHTTFFKYDTGDELHQIFNQNTINEIRKRMQPKDFLLCAWGWGHQIIASGVEDQCMAVESGIGYASTFSKYRVFESNAWMSWMYGNSKQDNGSWYDCVIPNFFDPSEFEFREKKDDYFLYLGRLIQRKGVDIAFQVTREIGAKLVVAGQGSLYDEQERIDIRGDHVEFVGFADLEKRKKLMAGAKGLFLPTYYIEPFGGVSIEAAFSGTPVMTTDWGVFPDTILHGITGYRCRTFEQFCWAAKNIDQISPRACRDWAVNNFSCDRVVKMYEEYFHQLHNLHVGGWYERNPGRTQLDWLKKEYPRL